MIATRLPAVNLTLPAPPAPRSDGTHVSSIIRCIAAETGILRPEWVDGLSLVDAREITDPTAVLRMSLGLAWEDYYMTHFLGPMWGVAHQPGEMKVAGIYMTHDGESLDTVYASVSKSLHVFVHEVKATYKSSKTVGDLAGEFMWLSQCKAYCTGVGTRFAKLHILYICGDYSFPIRPVLDVWQIEFTQQELDDNWLLLTMYKKDFESRKREGTKV